MSHRVLVVLGTASQAPTRRRNHNGYFLRWDEAGLLFDPGEGTQRQMLFAGVTASQIAAQSGARLLVLTHFSQRYESGDDKRLADEAASAFGGEVVLARDLDRIPVPPRRPAAGR